MSYKKIGLILILICLPVFFYFLSEDEAMVFQSTNANTNKGSARTETNPYLNQFAFACDSVFNVLMSAYATPGASVAIVYDTSVILLKGYGVRQINTTDSVNIRTVYRLASVSKPFASFLAGILIEDGAIKLDEPVTSYWPSFKLKSQESVNQISIRHVLSHTIGLPYHTFTNLIEEAAPRDSLLSYLREINLATKPGEVYSYQNVGYSIIGKVITQATARSYEDELHEKVFKPLGMADASTDYITLLANKNSAQPHLFKRGKLTATRINNTYYNVSPAGGINASIEDMAKWLSALLGNKPRVITKQTLDTLFAPSILANSKNRNFNKWKPIKKAHYGLGWRVLQFASDTVIYHGGYVEGYRSEVALLPKEKIAFCVLANAPGELIDTSIPVFLQLFERYRKDIKQWETKQELNL